MFARWILLAASTAASTCQYFGTTTVPTNDTSVPGAWVGVYDVATASYVALDVTNVQYTVTDPTATYAAVGAGYDPTGVLVINLHGAQWAAHCSADSGAIAVLGSVSAISDEQVASQSISPGATISNGLWLYNAVRFDQAPPLSCPEGLKLDHISFVWQLAAASYGLKEATAIGEMDYYPK